MILADKIINLRKKQGWSQEELAVRLDVSRQSVSKWENAASIPDLNKILQMSKLFDVTTDYLLKDEVETEQKLNGEIIVEENFEDSFRRVTMEEMADYLGKVKKAAVHIASGVALCIMSPILLILLAGMSEETGIITENMAAGIGIAVLLILVAVAVGLFLLTGFSLSKYEYLEKEDLDLEYGVAGAVADKKEKFASRYTRNMIIGVLLCIISVIPVVVIGCLDIAEIMEIYAVCVMLFLIAIAVYLFVYANMIQGAFQKLLEEGDYTRGNKRTEKRLEKYDGIYWVLMTAIYLGVSFYTFEWHRTWIIWPVAGVLFAVYRMIIKVIIEKRNIE